ncbi:hypothetical protein ThvES_00017540, partial [Thiovulum sp. ES]
MKLFNTILLLKNIVYENFDSSKIEDLKSIYKNLLFVKLEIDK